MCLINGGNMKKFNDDLEKLLNKIGETLSSNSSVVVKIEKGNNGRIFTEITPTEKIIIKI